MFYEEKVIDGALMCRCTPNGKWQLVSYHVLTERLMKAEAAARTEALAPAPYRYNIWRDAYGIECADISEDGEWVRWSEIKHQFAAHSPQEPK